MRAPDGASADLQDKQTDPREVEDEQDKEACASGLVRFRNCIGSATASAQQQKPNILFILADNVGYGDIGAYGGGELRGAPTPRIDRLASESLRLTQFLVEPSCTPSRAALMTGRYSIRSGLSLVAVPGTTFSLPATRNHDGRDAARRRLCHGDFRQMASWVRRLTVSRRTRASTSSTAFRLATPGTPSE